LIGIIFSFFSRDLKPENILLDDNFHIKLTDFGTARVLDEAINKQLEALTSPTKPDGKHMRRRNSFVGTAQFVSPECLQGQPPHIASDLWALGCIIFQMITGNHLFTGNHEYDIFQKVMQLRYTFPDEFPLVARDIVSKLVVTEPSCRLGANDYSELKSNEFFTTIDWNVDLSKEVVP